MTADTAQRLVSVEVAAEHIGVPYRDLLVWLLDHVAVSKTVWSHWKTGKKPIADKHLVEFLKTKVPPLERADRDSGAGTAEAPTVTRRATRAPKRRRAG